MESIKRFEVSEPKFMLFLRCIFSKKIFSFIKYEIIVKRIDSIRYGEDKEQMSKSGDNIQEARKQELILVEAMLKFSACFHPHINIHGRDYFIGFTPDGDFCLYTKKKDPRIVESSYTGKEIPIQ